MLASRSELATERLYFRTLDANTGASLNRSGHNLTCCDPILENEQCFKKHRRVLFRNLPLAPIQASFPTDPVNLSHAMIGFVFNVNTRADFGNQKNAVVFRLTSIANT